MIHEVKEEKNNDDQENFREHYGTKSPLKSQLLPYLFASIGVT